MFIQELTYTDFNGDERTEEFCFNLTQTEITEMDLSRVGGLTSYLTRIVKAKDVTVLSDTFRALILKAYGEKSDDGRYFNKSKDIADRFYHSAAYDVLYTKFMSEKDFASTFFIEVLPKDLKKELKDRLAKNPKLLEDAMNGKV